MAKKKKQTLSIDVSKHILVPKHKKISKKDAKTIFEKFRIGTHNLVKIKINDPAIQKLEPKLGDIIEIERQSPTAGKTKFYRVVVSE